MLPSAARGHQVRSPTGRGGHAVRKPKPHDNATCMCSDHGPLRSQPTSCRGNMRESAFRGFQTSGYPEPSPEASGFPRLQKQASLLCSIQIPGPQKHKIGTQCYATELWWLVTKQQKLTRGQGGALKAIRQRSCPFPFHRSCWDLQGHGSLGELSLFSRQYASLRGMSSASDGAV